VKHKTIIKGVFLILFLLIFVQPTIAQQEKLIIAHRGASAYETENTLESFQKAIDLNANMIELDVRKTKDNILIAFHNPSITNTPIKSLTYKQIQEKTSFHIPTLEETIKLTKGKIKLDIDLKETGYEKQLLSILQENLPKKDFIITSNNSPTLIEIKKIDKNIKTGLILKKRTLKNWALFFPISYYPKERIEESQADFIIPDQKFVTKNFLKQAEKNNKLVLPWSIKDKKTANRLLKEKAVVGIITKKPDLLS